MGSEIIIVPVLFSTIFGIFYMLISSRHKERMALIEKGMNASIFHAKDGQLKGLFPVLLLNLALLLFCMGLAIFIAGILHHQLGVKDYIAFPGSILMFAGLGLFTGYRMTLRYYEKSARQQD